MSKLVSNEPDHPTICNNLQWLKFTKILTHVLSWIVGWSGSASNFDLNFQAKQDTLSLFPPFFSSILFCYVTRLLQLTHWSLHCLLYASQGSEAHHTVWRKFLLVNEGFSLGESGHNSREKIHQEHFFQLLSLSPSENPSSTNRNLHQSPLHSNKATHVRQKPFGVKVGHWEASFWGLFQHSCAKKINSKRKHGNVVPFLVICPVFEINLFSLLQNA